MNHDVIFVRQNGALHKIERTTYDSEALLQEILADHPELLGGGQIRPNDPVRWLLVRREAGIADREDGSDRWSVDHLLLDQHAIPTFVEVKRSSDTRIRREVVGQMLDYAANATAYWPAQRIRDLAREQAGSEQALAARLVTLLGSEEEIEPFWARVTNNLRIGRVRLLFVADEIPSELRRIIEFLNEQMMEAEVLGVEVVRYQQGDTEAFVPRVIGQTEQALQTKTAAEPRPKSAKTNVSAFLDVCPPAARPAFERLISGAPLHGMRIDWGTKGFSVRLGGMSLFYGYPPGALGRETASMEAYLSYVPKERRADIRAAYLAAAPFRQAGEHTLVLPVTGPDDAVDRAIAALWRVAESLSDPASELDETPPPGSGEDRLAFWTAFLQHAQQQTHLFDKVNTTPTSFVGIGAGRGGLAYNVAVMQNRTQVELYFNGGDLQQNKARFDYFHEQRGRIEDAFGGPLDWQRLDGKKTCRICVGHAGGGLEDKAQWPQTIEATLQLALRLREALQLHIEAMGSDR
jgi:hypothetical protein